MRRRQFLALAGGLATWPLAARAQLALPLVGFLTAIASGTRAYLKPAFRRGLGEAGFAEGKNVAIEYRWAAGRYDRLPDLARELTRRNPSVVVADSTPALLAAKSVFGAIPIVFLIGADPVRRGFVASLNRPGANLTGLVLLTTELTAKRAELMIEAVPGIKAIALLGNPENANWETHTKELQTAARGQGVEAHFVRAGKPSDLDSAIAAIVEARAGAMVVQGDPFLDANQDRVIALAARHSIPAIFQWPEQAEAGGLISYGVDIRDAYRLVGAMAGQILNGRDPAELPVQQSTRINLVVNLKTAKALGLAIPEAILLRADEFIE